jgi:ABC-2 type transport system ATP-binding protein
MKNVIEMCGVSKKFGKKRIFDNLDFTVNENAIVGIIGGNGTGKSVLFKLMVGIETPDKGSIRVNNKTLGVEQDYPDDVGILINSPGFIEQYSGLSNLRFLAGIRNLIDLDKMKSTMTGVGLEWDNKIPVKKYSLGMKQRLGIAQAIMEDQTLLLLDEPFNSLDFQAVKDLKNIILEMKNEGNSVVLTSHNQDDLEICDKLYMLENYKLVDFDEEKRAYYFDGEKRNSNGE